MIHNILKENDFIKTGYDNYLLVTSFGEILLKNEIRLTERYTAREYVINKRGSVLIGKIYTNSPESFKGTLNRLLSHFFLGESKENNCVTSLNIVSLPTKDKKVKVS